MKSIRAALAVLPLALLLAAPRPFLAPLRAGESKNVLTLEQTAGRGGRVTFNTPIPSYSFDDDGALVERPAGREGESRRLDWKTLAELPAKPADKAEDAKGAQGAKNASDDADRSGRSERSGRSGRSGRPNRAGDTDADGAAASPSDSEIEAAFAALPEVGKDKASKLVAREMARFRHDGAVALVGPLGVVWMKGAVAKLILEGDPAPELAQASPDGRRVAYLRGSDLEVLDLADGRRLPLTSGGGKELLHGRLDWVYQEEVYGRGTWRGYFFSPDGRRLAFLSLDETGVAEFPLVDPIVPGTFRGKLDYVRYPKAGDKNPVVTLSIADLESGDPPHCGKVDLSQYAADEPIVAAVTFTPDSKRCLATVQDRRQSYADLLAIDVDSREWTRWIRETSASWVDRPDAPRWLSESEGGGFLWKSQRTGYAHLYRYGADGALVQAVTQGEWSVNNIVRIAPYATDATNATANRSASATAATVYFTAKKDGAIDGNVYRCGLDGKGIARITRDPGTHQLEFSPDGSLILDRFSSATTPPEVRLCDASGKVLKTLAKSEVAEDVAVAPVELHSVKARDGFPLDVSVLKPSPFRATASYPMWIITYSGPDMPTVQNRWAPNAWTQFLAQNGVIVLQVNVRTAAGLGNAISGKCHGRLGRQELEDIEDAVAWLTQNRWADGKRVGITGYSYGGFMAAYALTHSDAFALGIAGGGVYDWRMYDTIYTERYMDLPQRNPEGYAASSVIEAAKDLRGHLLFHHGVNDDNVHMQNALQLAYALEKADKSFEFVPYPETGHGIGDRDLNWHFRQLEWSRIQKHLVNARPQRN